MNKEINFKKRIDLHCHTNFSDGVLTPKELLLRAIQQQLDYLAITDHDAIGGYLEAKEVAIDYSDAPHLISGIELSCCWGRFEIHILGWHFDAQHEALLALIASQQEKRAARAEAIAKKLIQLGVAPEHIPKPEVGRVRTRLHFANALVRHGYVATKQAAFTRYLGQDKPAYVKTQWCTIETAVQTIRAAGGVAGLAHPHAYSLKHKRLKKLIQAFIDAGGTALEVAIGQQAPEQRIELAALAKEHSLYASVGSDFHFVGPWRELGRNLNLPEGVTPVWELWDLPA